MAVVVYKLNTILLLVFTVMVSQALGQEVCFAPLGMSNGNIKDSQITVSSNSGLGGGGKFARLHKNIRSWGAWCPKLLKSSVNVIYDDYIQIDLLNLTKIRKVAIQGRELNNGNEFTKTYQISYSNDNRRWIYYQENSKIKVFTGNTNVKSVVPSNINLPIVARYVRIHPGISDREVCLRLELYGCPVKDGIVSYSMPQGQTIKNGKIKYEDTIYDGIIRNGILYNGTGFLTDGKIGPVNSKENMGKEWVGWNTDSTGQDGVNITFKFSTLRRFDNVIVTMNLNQLRRSMLFNKSQILFGVREDVLSQSSALQYCPEPVLKSENINVTLSLCKNVGKFVRIQLYPAGRWMLISEIKFNSVPVSEGKEFRSCPADAEHRLCNVNKPLTTPSPSFTDGGTNKLGKSTNGSDSGMTVIIIIICLILILIIILIVVVFLLYRRRALCFAKLKRDRSNGDHTAVHIELNQRDDNESPYDKINEEVGNPLYASVDKNDDKQPMLSPVHTKAKAADKLKMSEKRESELYAKPDIIPDSPKDVPEEYAEPVDSVNKNGDDDDDDDDDTMANPIYEGVYSEPLYGVTGTILVGPQDETLKRGYTMDKFPKDKLVFKEKIGDGQFGEVHIAEADIKEFNTALGEEYKGKTKIIVAVKTLKTDVSKDIKTDFFKEVRVMSRLQHENVVRLLGVCREDPICMIVEYMENGDLNQFLRAHVLEGDDEESLYANTKLPIKYKDLMYIAFQVAAGMKYFASLKFVHRDLAARNCLVGDGLTVKLADFGMSRLLYSKHYYRVQGKVMLPIRWMAPESIFQGRFTTQTDVWSFGITLWEIFTLSRDFPYASLTDEQVIDNAKVAFRKRPSKIAYNEKPDICAQDVYDMMLRCWTSDPEKRPNFDALYNFLQDKVGPVGTAVI